MRQRASAWLPLALLALLAGLTGWLDRTVQPAASLPAGDTRHDVDAVVDNFRATRLGPDGKPRYSLAAVRLEHYPDDDSTHLTGPNFVNLEPGKAPLRVTSDTALVTAEGKEVFFRGNVKAVRDAFGERSELTVTTSLLHAIPDKHLVKTDKPVIIQDARMYVTAVGLELDNEQRTLKLLSQVKSRFLPPPRAAG